MAADDLNAGGETLSHASRIWSMLDDMAETNPAAYKAFIDKQLQEGRQYMQPPTPHMSVHVAKSSSTPSVFINFFSWPRVPKPKSEEAPIPVTGTRVAAVDTNEGNHNIANVAFNPEVLRMYGREASNAEERDALVCLAINYIEDQSKIRLSRSYTIEACDCKGSIAMAIDGLRGKDRPTKEVDELDELARTFGPLAEATRGSSISEHLLRMASSPPTVAKPENMSSEFELTIPSSSGGDKRSSPVLIEELATSLVQPVYRLLVKEASGEQHRIIIISVELPNVTMMSNCQLDIAKNELKLYVPDQYRLDLKLPEPVDELTATAKFVRKSHTLRITLPVIMSPR